MSQTLTATEIAPRRALTRRMSALALVAALGVAGALGASTPAQAAVTASVDTYSVQQGAYQTFFVSGLTPSSTLTVKLADTSTSTVYATQTYPVGASGAPTASYTRIQVPDTTPTGTAAYKLDFYDAGSLSATATVSGISVVAPTNTASITSVKVDGDVVRVTGEGWRRADTADNSVIGVKLNNGAIKHADTAGDLAPVPIPYPATGSSPVDAWYYIGAPNTDPTYASYNGASGYPNEDYASGDIVGGSFTVEIPIDTLASGTYQLRFLTGSLDDATWQTPSSATHPDQGRSVIVSFTK